MTQLSLEPLSLSGVINDQNVVSAWSRLAAIDPQASYFQTPAWVRSWWETVGQKPEGVVACVYKDSELVGLLALAEVRESLTARLPFRVRILANAGSGIGADHAGWLAVDGAADMLSTWVSKQSGVVLKGIPLPLGEALGGHLLESQRCPQVRIPDVGDLMSSRLAKNLRNGRRRLGRENVEFVWRGPGQVTLSDMQDLYRLHEVRRSGAGDASVFADPLRREFHELLLGTDEPGNGTAMMLAIQGDTTVGVLYGFVFKDTFSYYQVGWDPQFKRASLGSVLVLEAIGAAAVDGLETFDFLRGADEYKYKFGAFDLVEGSFAVGRSLGVLALRGASQLRGLLGRG